MATVTWMRPSGTEIETENTKEIRKFAKDNGWKKKKVDSVEPLNDLLSGADNGESGSSSESDTSGNSSSGDGS